MPISQVRFGFCRHFNDGFDLGTRVMKSQTSGSFGQNIYKRVSFRPKGEILGARRCQISPFARNDKVFVKRSTAFLLMGLLAASSLPVAHGAEIYGGTGLGFSNDPHAWVANLVFSGADARQITKVPVSASIHTGQDLTPVCNRTGKMGCQSDPARIPKVVVPMTRSNAWCDSATVPPITTVPRYKVTATFAEPNYESIPRDTVFRGYFDWDAETKTLSMFRGTMNQVMVSDDHTLSLTNLLAWSYDAVKDAVTATVFRTDSTSIYTAGNFIEIPSSPETNGTSNAYLTLNFSASDPASVTTLNIDRLVYGDCIGGSLMGKLCMTGLKSGGTMSGYPKGLDIKAVNLPVGTPGSTCYGSSGGSKWAIIDLNALQKVGLKQVAVHLAVNRVDDDFVPALTVFRGRQDVGVHGFWYPNQFQDSPEFWAWKLTPFHTTPSESDPTGGWATAHGADPANGATVDGVYALRADEQNYLTVAVGGDDRDSAAHDVKFKLSVTLSAQP